jgi:uncharacterized protein CbrC (UPF0167 family)
LGESSFVLYAGAEDIRGNPDPRATYCKAARSYHWPTPARSELLLVVNDGLVEFTLSALDVLLDGEGLAVLGERDSARRG